jgi:hypothetical protein
MPISNSSFPRGRNAQRLENADKVIPDRVEHDHVDEKDRTAVCAAFPPFCSPFPCGKGVRGIGQRGCNDFFSGSPPRESRSAPLFRVTLPRKRCSALLFPVTLPRKRLVPPFCSPFPCGKGARGIGRRVALTFFPVPLPHFFWGRGQGLGCFPSTHLNASN